MKVLIAGGYGFVGKDLAAKLLNEGYEVTIGGRGSNKNFSIKGIDHLEADFMIKGQWQEQIKNFDVIINLVGVNIFQRWNPEIKELLFNSRILSTRNIVEGLKGSKKKKILINASAVGIYGDRGDQEVDEKSETGNDFLSHICQHWEKEALVAKEYGVRVAIVRFGTILGKNGGAFQQMEKKFKAFMGTKLGSGKQWFPWIHIEDVISAIIRIIRQSKMEGIYNLTSPGYVTNGEFTKKLASALKRPLLIPFVPKFMLKIVFGEFGSYLVFSQKVVPARLMADGFKFKYSDVDRALNSLIEK